MAERIIGCAIEVHRVIAVDYKGRPLRTRLRIDLLVETSVVIELKAVDGLRPVHSAQVMSYLRLTGHPAGLLINFNEVTLRAGLKRLDHPTRYAASKHVRNPKP